MANSAPLVSVVVPCRNRAHLLRPTIDSILNQSYPNVECIVVDGASTDGTTAILESYGDRIRWVSEPDRGPIDAINKGWKMARGEILTWLNADDVWEVPDAVATAVAAFEAAPQAAMVYGECGSIDADGRLTGMSYLHRWDLEHAVVNCDHCIPQPASFLRRSAVERAGWLDTELTTKHDHEYWLRVAMVGEIRYVPALLAHARETPGTWTSRGDQSGEACIEITRKFLARPDVPRSIRRQRRRAMSNAHLRAMNYAFAFGRHWRLILRWALAAVLWYPANADAALQRVRGYVVEASGESRVVRWGARAFDGLFAIRRAVGALLGRAPPGGERLPNLVGDRDIEWSFVAGRMPWGPGKALDFGNGGSPLALMAAERGFDATAIDRLQVSWPYTHPSLRFLSGDLMVLPLPTGEFDLVINCSTVEHVGLVGRYDFQEAASDGDLAAMSRLRALLKPGGTMLLTVPVGRDAVFLPMARVYGDERLPKLLSGFEVESEEYWTKDESNKWRQTSRALALAAETRAGSWDPRQNVYGLGCFVLRRPTEGGAPSGPGGTSENSGVGSHA